MADETALIIAPFSSIRWTDRFALDLAMSLENSGYSIDTLLEEHKFTSTDLAEFVKDPIFEQRVTKYRTDLRENGLTFKVKAQAQAEMLLDTSWDIIHHVDVSPAVKADLIKWTAKVAGYDNKENNAVDTGGGVVININMGDAATAPAPGIRIIEASGD